VLKRILVGFDPEEGDRAPALFGAAVSRYTRAPLVVVAVHAASAAFAAVGHDLVDEEEERQTRRRLDHLRRDLATGRARAECVSRPGSEAARELRDAAREFRAGLIVVGSSARGGLRRLAASSTAQRLLHDAPCPVAVVPRAWEPGGGLHTIGAAFQDTPEGRDALSAALELGRRSGATVRAIVAVDAPEDVREAGADERAMAEGETGAGRPDVDVDVRVGDAADVLIEASGDVDLLICGSRGARSVRAVLVGSVSRLVTAEACCPVIVLARGIQSGLDAIFEDREGAPA
jgi:nucleotide-binding universal stress UspA family protein